MKISTHLAAAMLLFTSITVSAQDLKGSLDYSKAFTTSGYAQPSAPTAITSEGNVVVTSTVVAGASLQSFVGMADKDLPSAFIWKTTISGGRSVVTAIVPDAEGGVYVGGNFNQEITVGDFTLSGSTSSNYNKRNAFVAHIDKSGNVLAAKSIVTNVNGDLMAAFPSSYTDNDKVYCNLTSMVVVGGKLYAALLFTDILKTTDGATSITSPTYNLSSWGMGVGSSTALAVAEISTDDMALTSFPYVYEGDGDYNDSSYWNMSVQSVQLAADDTNVYVAATPSGYSGKGVAKLAGTQVGTTNFTYSGGGVNGCLVAKINLTDFTYTQKAFDATYKYTSFSTPGVGALQAKDGNLYIAGSFLNELPFDTSVKATGTASSSWSGVTDMYVAQLNAEDLSVAKTFASGYDEFGVTSADEEKFASFAIDGNKVTVTGYASYTKDAYSDALPVKPITMTIDDITAEGATATVSDADEDYTISQAVSGDRHYYAFLTGDQTGLKYRYTGGTATAIKSVPATADAAEAIYTIQGVKLSAPQRGVNIIGGKKVVIK